MRRKILSLTLTLTVFLGLCISAAAADIDLSRNQYIKVSENPISWVRITGKDATGVWIDKVAMLLSDDVLITVTVPDKRGSSSLLDFYTTAGGGGTGLENFSARARTDLFCTITYQNETIFYITENYATKLVSQGFAVDRISAEEASKIDNRATQFLETDIFPNQSEVARPTNDKLEVNGNAADPTVYKIGGSNYFKIRDVAALLNGTEKQFAVGYDGSKNAVTATTGQGYDKQSGDLAGAAKGGDQSASASNDAIYVNGEKITAEVYKIGGSNYFKLRDLGKALDFYVGWSAQRGMYIETDKPYSE